MQGWVFKAVVLISLGHIGVYFFWLGKGALCTAVVLLLAARGVSTGVGFLLEVSRVIRTPEDARALANERAESALLYLACGSVIPLLWGLEWIGDFTFWILFLLYSVVIPVVVLLIGGLALGVSATGKVVGGVASFTASAMGADEKTARQVGQVTGRVAQVALLGGVLDGVMDLGGGEALGDGSFEGGEMMASNEAIPEMTGDGYGPPDETYGLPSEVDGDLRNAHYVEGYTRADGTYVAGHWKSPKG